MRKYTTGAWTHTHNGSFCIGKTYVSTRFVLLCCAILLAGNTRPGLDTYTQRQLLHRENICFHTYCAPLLCHFACWTHDRGLDTYTQRQLLHREQNNNVLPSEAPKDLNSLAVAVTFGTISTNAVTNEKTMFFCSVCAAARASCASATFAAFFSATNAAIFREHAAASVVGAALARIICKGTLRNRRPPISKAER